MPQLLLDVRLRPEWVEPDGHAKHEFKICICGIHASHFESMLATKAKKAKFL